MGNRAVITTAPYSDDSVGIYVHWNGGRASVEGFLAAAKALGYRQPGHDPSYALARLTQVISTFFEDGLCVGIGVNRQLDCNNGDNGVYVIDGDWEIVGREFVGEGSEAVEEVDAAKTASIANLIVNRINAANTVKEA